MSRDPVLLLANGNLNGRTIRLIADDLHRRRMPVRLVTTAGLIPWPEERDHPHIVPPASVSWEKAEFLVRSASLLILPASWDRAVDRITAVARDAGTPVVCVVADFGYGARKLDPSERQVAADQICVGDPVTHRHLVSHGVAPPFMREVGSPHIDTVLAAPRRLRLPGRPLRIGLLANPDGMRELHSDPDARIPEEVLPAVNAVLGNMPDARLTVRLHPRQDASLIATHFHLPDQAAFDPFPAATALHEFVADHDLIVGSYSMGLLIARFMGCPVVSYQPVVDDTGIRREIFGEWDIPVATDPEMLAATMADRLRDPGRPLDPASVLYNPGASLDAIAEVVAEVMPRQRRRSIGLPLASTPARA
jgi:hypothetical protein